MTVIMESLGLEIKAPSNDNDKAAFPMEPVIIRGEDYAKVTEELRDVFKTGKTLTYSYRMDQLKNLNRMLVERAHEFEEVLYKDLRKPKMEASGEILAVDVEVAEAMRCLQTWMTPEKLPNNLLFPSDRAYIKHDPYGVVLIIGAWNYPLILTLQPLVGAIAAGNCAIIKPSEISPCTAAKIAELLPLYLDSKCFRVVQGDVCETTELLKQKYDYIFSTSSTRVGKYVMAAAAMHLTPVTLELGGKSPVYIHDSADMDLSMKRILWGKMTNMGQTCIAPDYIICSKKVQDHFVKNAKKVFTEWYGANMKESSDISRIINVHHFNRLKKLLTETKGEITLGGEFDSSDLWISPTLVVNVADTDVLMEDEIFGPILPFVRAETEMEALTYLNNKKAKPLALYLFSQDKKIDKLFLDRTTSGTFSINEVVLHCGWQGLPFGGIGDSGLGSYHGRYSFETFTHRKSVLARDFSFVTEKLSAIRYPPYESTELKIQFLTSLLKKLHLFKITCSFGISHVFMFCFGILVMYMTSFYASRLH